MAVVRPFKAIRPTSELAATLEARAETAFSRMASVTSRPDRYIRCTPSPP